jgi:hypothetical protein
LIFLNQAYFALTRMSAYRLALSDTLRAAESERNAKPMRDAAAKLLLEREEALKKLEEIDRTLGEELNAAKRANRDADTFAITQTLLGAGGTLVQSYDKPADSKGQAVPAAQAQLPSTTVMQLMRQRIEYEGAVQKSDTAVLTFTQKNGRSLSVPPPR